MIELEKNGPIFTLTMDYGENRWNTRFINELSDALDEVEHSDGPAALVTIGGEEKFYSNGLDLDWRKSPTDKPEAGDPANFPFMEFMGRMITMPIPTLAAVNGHAFGAGFMFALCHDYRLMRADRGYICANEMQLGMAIPAPELSLFRHKLPANVFYESVQLARRWSGPDALDAGIVQQVAPIESLLEAAVQKAKELAPLGANRKIFQQQKERLFGENAILSDHHGAAFQLKNKDQYQS
ncbi:MAG: enoyl-CoA hydratase/carnithine racemase [Candidatus Azotimanducaceae bacterium]|jgi:enoyl-CoA hydratase/carnithine racemase